MIFQRKYNRDGLNKINKINPHRTQTSPKATAKNQQKEGKDDPTTPLNTAKNILQKSPTKESVSTQKQRKKTTGKTPLKEAAST